MLSKIKFRYKKILWSHFRDTRIFALFVFLVIVLLITWSGIKAIQTNYGLQKQISQTQAEVQVQQLENTNLQLENEYYNTNQYLELSARQNFGLAQPGETEVIIPQNVALSHIVSINSPIDASVNPQTITSNRQNNFEAWINFFLHRQSSSN